MKVGYPCINLSIGCSSSRTFRLKSYSEERFIATVANNLDCLQKILEFNIAHNILFFRISSNLIPFASHPVCTFAWQRYFKPQFTSVGGFIKKHNIRISMHPDQFTLINSRNTQVFHRSVRELLYHVEVLDLMGLDASAKVQLHIGGVYGCKKESMRRFKARYWKLEERIRKRLVIENDDTSYSLADCIAISSETGIPVLFDILHHKLNNSGHMLPEALKSIYSTWRQGEDGLPMVDYSYPLNMGKKGRHAESIDPERFAGFLRETEPFDFDVMLEIKDKERSAISAVTLASSDGRLYRSETS